MVTERSVVSTANNDAIRAGQMPGGSPAAGEELEFECQTVQRRRKHATSEKLRGRRAFDMQTQMNP
jgi:hypothetical protein